MSKFQFGATEPVLNKSIGVDRDHFGVCLLDISKLLQGTQSLQRWLPMHAALSVGRQTHNRNGGAPACLVGQMCQFFKCRDRGVLGVSKTPHADQNVSFLYLPCPLVPI